MSDPLSARLVPDALWALAEPLLPRFSTRPQGGGTSPLPARTVFTAVVFVVTSGSTWRDLPPSLGVPFQTAHRRFAKWSKDGLWQRLSQVAHDGGTMQRDLADWCLAIVAAADTRATALN